MQAFFISILCIAFSSALTAAELKVFAATSLTDVLNEIESQYEKTAGYSIEFNFGASNLLARQIQQGAEADLFISADEAIMDSLDNNQLILTNTRKQLLSNRLAIITPMDSKIKVVGAKDLLRSEVKRIALAEPQSVPAGIYAKEYLQKQKLWGQVIDKIIPTENVRAALSAVESGNVDTAIVYRTDARISKKVKIVCEISEEEGPPISYPMAILRQSKEPVARDFYSYLLSLNAKRIFEKHGFIFIKE